MYEVFKKTVSWSGWKNPGISWATQWSHWNDLMINNDDLINQIDDNNKGDKGIRLVRGARIKATLISVSQGIDY